jgi:hypothetical protein
MCPHAGKDEVFREMYVFWNCWWHNNDTNEATGNKEHYRQQTQSLFAARDIDGPPPTLNIAVAGRPEAYILGRLCLQLKPVLVYGKEPGACLLGSLVRKTGSRELCTNIQSQYTTVLNLAHSFVSSILAIISPL